MAWLSTDAAGPDRLRYLLEWEADTDREIEDLEHSIAMLQQTVASAQERIELIRRLARVIEQEQELRLAQRPVEPSPVIDVKAIPEHLRVKLPASREGTEADGRIEQLIE